jgi:hypothetical protein
MNRLSVTVIDILGLLVPGVALIFGVLLVPIPAAWLKPLGQLLMERMPLLSNPWVSGGCWLATAYVLGFLLRLVSISIVSKLAGKQWFGRVERDAKAIDEVFELALGNPRLSKSLKELAEKCGVQDLGKYAPYFHFSKRLVRGSPELWVEVERLEAEVRFAAGLFVPCVVLAIDGALRGLSAPESWILFLVGIAGAALILRDSSVEESERGALRSAPRALRSSLPSAV